MQGHAGVAREGAQQELALDGLSGAPGGFGLLVVVIGHQIDRVMGVVGLGDQVGQREGLGKGHQRPGQLQQLLEQTLGMQRRMA